MGSCYSCLNKSHKRNKISITYQKRSETKLILMGLEGSGKSEILAQLTQAASSTDSTAYNQLPQTDQDIIPIIVNNPYGLEGKFEIYDIDDTEFNDDEFCDRFGHFNCILWVIDSPNRINSLVDGYCRMNGQSLDIPKDVCNICGEHYYDLIMEENQNRIQQIIKSAKFHARKGFFFYSGLMILCNDKGRQNAFSTKEIEEQILNPIFYRDEMCESLVITLPYNGETGDGLEKAMKRIKMDFSKCVYTVSD